MIQEAMNKMRQAFDENSKKFGMEKLSFEAVQRLIYENRNSAKQSIKAQQEKAMQKAERREEEVRRFKEEQKQIKETVRTLVIATRELSSVVALA